MTQENKDLLFNDISSRLSYRVKFPIYWWNEETQTDEEIIATLYSINTDGYCEIFDHDGTVYIDNIKPYLRPLSSMTEEEESIFINKQGYDRYDWLNEKMFDYRGLIPRELALEASEDIYIIK